MFHPHQYKHTLFLVGSIILACILFFSGYLHVITHTIAGYGYVTAFLAGMLFTISFTSAIASFVFIELGNTASPILFAIVGGFGAMVSDLLLYRFLKTSLLEEWKLIMASRISIQRRAQMERITKNRVFIWTVPFIASALIASPVPDEVGVALFSVINFHPKYFSLISFLANMGGIFVLLTIGSIV
jgi:hypothetical protein